MLTQFYLTQVSLMPDIVNILKLFYLTPLKLRQKLRVQVVLHDRLTTISRVHTAQLFLSEEKVL